MNQTLAVTKIEAVEEIGPGIFEVRVLLEDASTATLRMNGYTLCSLADMVSQYATPQNEVSRNVRGEWASKPIRLSPQLPTKSRANADTA